MTIPTTPTPASPTPASIGCDVGKAGIAVFDSRTGRSTTIANQPQAIDGFVATLDRTCLVVCEATGGYEALLLHGVTQAGHYIHRADARRVKAFIRSLGTLGKTDAIDARALARYGQERHRSLALWQPADAARDALHALVMARRDLTASRTAWSNRAGAPTAGAAAPFLAAVIERLDEQIEAIGTEIQTVIADQQALRQTVRTLQSVPGIGAVTAAALAALMPELGRLDRRAAAALAGLAPHPNQSGGRDGYRRVRGGRPEVRRVLFMAAMSAAQHHPQLRQFHARLIAAGKKPIVAITAVMRKLIVICNAKLRSPAAISPAAISPAAPCKLATQGAVPRLPDPPARQARHRKPTAMRYVTE